MVRPGKLDRVPKKSFWIGPGEEGELSIASVWVFWDYWSDEGENTLTHARKSGATLGVIDETSVPTSESSDGSHVDLEAYSRTPV